MFCIMSKKNFNLKKNGVLDLSIKKNNNNEINVFVITKGTF